MYQICENIKRVRTQAGKSQQEMSELLNVKRSTYAKWELTTIPDVLSLINIGKVLSIDWTSLVAHTITGEALKRGKPATSQSQQIKENTEIIISNTEAILKATAEILEKVNNQKRRNPN